MLGLILKETLSILTAKIIFKHTLQQWEQKWQSLLPTFSWPQREIITRSHFKPHTWKRYIDNVFSPWNINKEEINSFIELANSYHPTIKQINRTTSSRTLLQSAILCSLHYYLSPQVVLREMRKKAAHFAHFSLWRQGDGRRRTDRAEKRLRMRHWRSSRRGSVAYVAGI